MGEKILYALKLQFAPGVPFVKTVDGMATVLWRLKGDKRIHTGQIDSRYINQLLVDLAYEHRTRVEILNVDNDQEKTAKAKDVCRGCLRFLECA